MWDTNDRSESESAYVDVEGRCTMHGQVLIPKPDAAVSDFREYCPVGLWSCTEEWHFITVS